MHIIKVSEKILLFCILFLESEVAVNPRVNWL